MDGEDGGYSDARGDKGDAHKAEDGKPVVDFPFLMRLDSECAHPNAESDNYGAYDGEDVYQHLDGPSEARGGDGRLGVGDVGYFLTSEVRGG